MRPYGYKCLNKLINGEGQISYAKKFKIILNNFELFTYFSTYFPREALTFLLIKCGLCIGNPKEYSMERGATLGSKRLTDISLAQRQCPHQQW